MQVSKPESSFVGALWLVSGSTVQSGLKIIITAILARMISPADFGLAAAAMSVITLANLINGAGSGSYLVQKKEVNQVHFNTVFTYSIVAGLLTSVIIYLLRYPISYFFKMPELTGIITALIVLFPVQAFYRVSYCYLQRNLLFKKMAGLDVLSYLLAYGFIGVLMAYFDYGVWALVFAAISQAVLYALFLYLSVPVKPSFSLSTEILPEILKQGSGYLAINIFSYGANQGDYWVVGNTLGSVQLGYYSRAFTLMTTPHSIFGSVINKILFAKFSKAQDNQQHLVSILKRTVAVLLFFGIPLSFLFILNGRELILVFLGPQWEESVLPFKILSVGLIAKVGVGSLINYLLGIGLLKKGVRVYFLYFTVIVLGALFGAYYGDIVHVALGVTCALLAAWFYIMFWVFRYAQISYSFIFRHIVLNILLALPYILVIEFLKEFLRYSISIYDVVILLLNLLLLVLLYLAYYKLKIYRLLGKEISWLLEKRIGF